MENKVFACVADAKDAIKLITKGLKYHKITCAINSVEKHKKKSRPTAQDNTNIISYQVVGLISEGEHAFRCLLETSNDTIPNQLGKKSKAPTMRWVFRILNKIMVAYFNIDGTKQWLLMFTLCVGR